MTIGVAAVSVTAHEIVHDTFTDNSVRGALDNVLRRLRPVEVLVPNTGLSKATEAVLRRWTMDQPCALSVHKQRQKSGSGGGAAADDGGEGGGSSGPALRAGVVEVSDGDDSDGGDGDGDGGGGGDGQGDSGGSDSDGDGDGGSGDDGEGDDGGGDEPSAGAASAGDSERRDDGVDEWGIVDTSAAMIDDVSNLQAVLFRKPDRFVTL